MADNKIEIDKSSSLSTSLGFLGTIIACVAITVSFYYTNVKGEINSKANKTDIDSLANVVKESESMKKDMFYLLIKYIKINNPDADLDYFIDKYKIVDPDRKH